MNLNINWEKAGNLIPAIVQHIKTQQILMLGYMNPEALEKTLESGQITFYSRSRKTLWKKGETSGNTLKLCKIITDCDQDALLLLAEPAGPTCHTGSTSCFGESPSNRHNDVLEQLRDKIQERKKNRLANSYVSELFNSGTARIAQKVGEEGVEVALAAVCKDKKALSEETADLLFHLLILMEDQNIEWQDILGILKTRQRS